MRLEVVACPKLKQIAGTGKYAKISGLILAGNPALQDFQHMDALPEMWEIDLKDSTRLPESFIKHLSGKIAGDPYESARGLGWFRDPAGQSYTGSGPDNMSVEDLAAFVTKQAADIDDQMQLAGDLDPDNPIPDLPPSAY